MLTYSQKMRRPRGGREELLKYLFSAQSDEIYRFALFRACFSLKKCDKIKTEPPENHRPMGGKARLKRIKSACLEQTIHFELSDKLPHDEAVAAAEKEAGLYKRDLARKGIPCRVDREETLPDGTHLLVIRRQYNSYPTGTYLD